MRDKTHKEFIKRWANFVKKNPINIWKSKLNLLIDSQIINANRFYSQLLKTKNGEEKLKLLRR